MLYSILPDMDRQKLFRQFGNKMELVLRWKPFVAMIVEVLREFPISPIKKSDTCCISAGDTEPSIMKRPIRLRCLSMAERSRGKISGTVCASSSMMSLSELIISGHWASSLIRSDSVSRSKYLPLNDFAKVVLPHCRGPISATAGWVASRSKICRLAFLRIMSCKLEYYFYLVEKTRFFL